MERGILKVHHFLAYEVMHAALQADLCYRSLLDVEMATRSHIVHTGCHCTAVCATIGKTCVNALVCKAVRVEAPCTHREGGKIDGYHYAATATYE